MEYTWLWCVAGGAALLITALFWFIARRVDRKSGASPLLIFTVGVFLSVFVLHLPVYFIPAMDKDLLHYLLDAPQNFASELFATMRVVILEGEHSIVTDALAGQPGWLRMIYGFLTAAFLVLAPILTFGNILSMFKDSRYMLRLWLGRKKKLFVFSELNEKSLALAKSIPLTDALMVFARVGEDAPQELLVRAEEEKFMCVHRTVTQLELIKRKGDVEVFFIGENQGDNVTLAVRIAKALEDANTKFNVKLFVFSREKSSGYILDSLHCPKLREHAKLHDYDETTFKLRRVDEIRQLAWNTVPEMKVFEKARANSNVISVLIAGMGRYGMEFFKTLCWYCQFEGYRLKLTVVDSDPDLEERINHMCPDLLKNNRSTVDGDAWYDICCIPGVDIASHGLDSFLRYDGFDPEKLQVRQRLREVNFALVMLGDDDRNIQVAVELRSLFDRLHGMRAKKTILPEQEPVQIYAVVYDEEKSGLLGENAQAKESFLRNHKDVPYHIHFVGALAEQFNYKNVYGQELEESAYQHHIGWAVLEQKIYQEWLEKFGKEKVDAFGWYYGDALSAEGLEENREAFERYEYFRHSSIAKELYRRGTVGSGDWSGDLVISQVGRCVGGTGEASCRCNNCVRRKRSEHMRWNAYTRILGYARSDCRADRAMLHDNLVGWDELSELDRDKD